MRDPVVEAGEGCHVAIISPVAPRTLPLLLHPPRTAGFGITPVSRYCTSLESPWPLAFLGSLGLSRSTLPEFLCIQTGKSLRTLPDKHCPFQLPSSSGIPSFSNSLFFSHSIFGFPPNPDFSSPVSTEPYARPPRCRRARNLSSGPLLTSSPRPARRSLSCPPPALHHHIANGDRLGHRASRGWP